MLGHCDSVPDKVDTRDCETAREPVDKMDPVADALELLLGEAHGVDDCVGLAEAELLRLNESVRVGHMVGVFVWHADSDGLLRNELVPKLVTVPFFV